MADVDKDEKEEEPEKKTEAAKNRELLIKLDGMFKASLNDPTWKDWREHAQKCFDYKEGIQWTPDELTELKERNQPPSVNNQVSMMIDWLMGQYVKSKTKISYRGRNSPDDNSIADTYSKIFLQVSQDNELNFEKKDMAEDGFTGGFGVLDTFIDYDENLEPRVGIEHEDCFNMFPAPFSKKYDWNKDMQYIGRAKWLELDHAINLWPGKKAELKALADFNPVEFFEGENEEQKLSDYYDKKRKRVRPVEMEWKKKEKQVLGLKADGEVVDLTDDGIKKFEKENIRSRIHYKNKDVVMTAVFCGNVILQEEKERPHDHNYFRWVPYFVKRMKSGEPYSKAHISLPIQDAINKRESKALHLLNVNQVVYEETAVEDKVELAKEMAKPDGLIKLRRGQMKNFSIEKNLDLAVTQMGFHGQSLTAYRQVWGINPDALGEKSEVRSGIGIARKQASSEIMVLDPFDNLIRTDKLLARNVQALVKQYYTSSKILLITDDLGATEEFKINTDETNTLKNGGVMDIIAENTPDTTTMQQEQYNLMVQQLPALAQLPPGYMKLAIQMSDLRNKEALLTIADQMTQKPPEKPKMSLSMQWNNLQPYEKAFFAMEMGNEGLAQMILQKNELTEDEVKIEIEKMRSTVELQKTGIKAQTDVAIAAQKEGSTA